MPVLASADTSPHSEGSLVSSLTIAEPDVPFDVIFRLKLNPGWHSYWINPGDSGVPTKLDWSLPPGWKVSPLVWPVPQRFTEGGMTSYGYADEALFLVTLTPPKQRSGTPAKLVAKASWLVCQEACLPASQTMSLSVVVGSKAKPNPAWNSLAAKAQRNLPSTQSMAVTAIRQGDEVRIELQKFLKGEDYQFFASQPALIDPNAPQRLEGQTLILKVSPYASTFPKTLHGVLVWKNQGRRGTSTVMVPLSGT
jgi:thiol:disulfide interchange protein DsbD